MVDVTDLTAGLRSRPFIAGEIWEFDLQHSRGRADRGREEEVSQLQVSYCGAMASEAQAIVELVEPAHEVSNISIGCTCSGHAYPKQSRILAKPVRTRSH